MAAYQPEGLPRKLALVLLVSISRNLYCKIMLLMLLVMQSCGGRRSQIRAATTTCEWDTGYDGVPGRAEVSHGRTHAPKHGAGSRAAYVPWSRSNGEARWSWGVGEVEGSLTGDRTAKRSSMVRCGWRWNSPSPARGFKGVAKSPFVDGVQRRAKSPCEGSTGETVGWRIQAQCRNGPRPEGPRERAAGSLARSAWYYHAHLAII